MRPTLFVLWILLFAKPSLSQPGWPQIVYGYENMWIGTVSPTIADLENDGAKELTFVTQGTPESEFSSLCIYEADGQLRARTNFTHYCDPRALPSIADLDNDGTKEIVVDASGGQGPRILLFDFQGALIEDLAVTCYKSDDLYGAIVLADVNNDNEMEMIYGGWAGPAGTMLVALDLTGGYMAGFPVVLENSQMSTVNTPAVGNLCGDSKLEIVTVSHLNNQPPDSTHIRAFGSEGALLWSQSITGLSFSDPAVGDIDDDGLAEVAVTSERGVHVFDADGTPRLQLDIGTGGTHSNLALADLDDDHDLEIIFGYQLDLYAIHHDGTEIFAFRSDSPTQHPPIVGDMDGDERLDVAFNSWDVIYALDAGGNMLMGFPKQMLQLAYSSPSLDDVDHDGSVDLMSSSNWIPPGLNIGVVYVWELDGAYDQSRTPWPTYQHDAQHTGYYHDEVAVGLPLAAGGDRRPHGAVHNFPDPFGLATEIKYLLREDADVHIDIFGPSGRYVMTLTRGWQPAGERTARWDASNCLSGVYFYRIQAGEGTLTGRMTLIK